ncbi:universal stress protein [uncultured Rhodoblastus sp.]|uniref:universal stress protein n=1 Tax=uncultured Rhodoblastus sp. TaxID=543037 RepID=UPI0025E4CD9C|nr:universal stress protein [uncultured Rhodoblastus sp.]
MSAPSFSPPETASPRLHICALLPEAETALSTLQCAVAAARAGSAKICAVHVGFDAEHSFISAEEQDIQQLRDLHEGGPKARTARVRAVFDAFVAAAPDAPPLVWRDDPGDIRVCVEMEANAAQLVVVGRPVHLDAADALHSALFDAQSLVLVAPRAASAQRTVGRHVVVGWKPGAAVEQAVETALPWLRRAERVTVLWTEKDGVEPYDVGARAFFAQLGIAAEFIRLRRDLRSVGAQLLDRAALLGGDCLLIGAYRHGALWQAVLGGVTRDVLAQAELPVFLMRAG